MAFTIINQSRELSRAERAALFINHSQSIKDCDGQTLIVTAVCEYEKENASGDAVHLMGFLLDDGTAVTTSSPTVMRSFNEIVDSLGIDTAEENIPLRVISGVTKSGRTYFDVEYDSTLG